VRGARKKVQSSIAEVETLLMNLRQNIHDNPNAHVLVADVNQSMMESMVEN